MKTQFVLKLDLEKTGLNMFFKPYQKKALEILWNHPEGMSTRQVWETTKAEIPTSISRASIINFLASAADYDMLEFREISGKGGYRRIYSPKYDRDGLSSFLTDTVKKALQTL